MFSLLLLCEIELILKSKNDHIEQTQTSANVKANQNESRQTCCTWLVLNCAGVLTVL